MIKLLPLVLTPGAGKRNLAEGFKEAGKIREFYDHILHFEAVLRQIEAARDPNAASSAKYIRKHLDAAHPYIKALIEWMS